MKSLRPLVSLAKPATRSQSSKWVAKSNRSSVRSNSTEVKQQAQEQQLTAANLQPPSASTSDTPRQPHVPEHLYQRLPAHCLLPDGTPDYVRLILNSRVYDLLQPTPMTSAKQLSLKTGCNVLLKREDLQPVFSFKIRGAFNLVANLTQEEKAKGVIACSAGEHVHALCECSIRRFYGLTVNAMDQETTPKASPWPPSSSASKRPS